MQQSGFDEKRFGKYRKKNQKKKKICLREKRNQMHQTSQLVCQTL